MKIIITENQLNFLLENGSECNKYKLSVETYLNLNLPSFIERYEFLGWSCDHNDSFWGFVYFYVNSKIPYTQEDIINMENEMYKFTVEVNGFIKTYLGVKKGSFSAKIDKSNLIITEDKKSKLLESKSERLKELLKDQFNFDLTNNVHLVRTVDDVPFGYDTLFSKDNLRKILKDFNPIYLFSMHAPDLWGSFLFYDIVNDPTVVDNRGWHYDENEFMDKIGLSYIGVSFRDILDLYL